MPGDRPTPVVELVETLRTDLDKLDQRGRDRLDQRVLARVAQAGGDAVHGQQQSALQLRVAVTGRRVSPPLFESLELLGRETSLARLATS